MKDREFRFESLKWLLASIGFAGLWAGLYFHYTPRPISVDSKEEIVNKADPNDSYNNIKSYKVAGDR